MEKRNLQRPIMLWKPKETAGSRVKKFWRYVNEKYHLEIENFWELHKWSVDNLEAFWAEMWEMSGIIYSKPFKRVVDTSVSMADRPEWFPGARLNFAQNLLRFRDERVALVAAGEERETAKITYAEVYRQACRYGAAFRKLGLKKNDCVVCYMPSREECVFAMLGAVSIGAVWSGALPLLGSQAVLNRFRKTQPKFLIASDRFLNDGQEEEMLSKVKEIANELTCFVKVIIVPSSNPNSRKKDIRDIKNSCFLDEFLSLAENPDGSVPDLVFEQVPYSHPVFISYTSGTTGVPKAIVHGSTNLLTTFLTFQLQCDTGREGCWLSLSPVGWTSWNIFTSFLFLGMKIIVYEGVPYYKTPTALWDLVDDHGITNLFLTPTLLDELEKKGYVPGETNHLTSLKVIMSGASVVKPQNFDFVYNKLKKGILFGSAYGCSEINGVCLGIESTVPVYRGEIPAPALGFDLKIYNEAGAPVEGELGDVVIATHVPTFPVCMWGDEDGKLYKESYFTKFPNVFCTGDLGFINAVTRGTIIVCRNDDTLKPKGCRFGSSEIYNVVDTFPEVKDSLCVPQYDQDSNERAVLFLLMRDGHQFNEDLVQRIRVAIERELSARHVPSVIIETKAIPHNLNGKKMEIIVKKVINNMPYNAENVSNPECLKFFENIPDLQGF